MKLICDTREKSRELLEYVDAHYDNVLYSALHVGDYLWCNDDDETLLAIEHKSVSDFYQSTVSGHIDTQVADLKQYPHFCVFIDGDWRSLFRRNSPCKPFAYNNKILSIECIHNVPVHHFRTTEELGKAIIDVGRMLERNPTGGRIEDVIRNKFTRNKLSPNYQMYSALDGMGKKRIDELMKLYPHFSDFIQAYKSGVEFPKSIVNKKTREFLDSMEVE